MTRLHEAGYPIGMGTNGTSKNTQVIIDRLGIGPLLTTVVTGDDVEYGKPDPQMYVTLAARLGADPRNSVGVEDTPTGLAALRGSGAYSIALFTPGGGQDLSLANWVASWHDITPEAIKSIPLPRGRR
jgi:beta-phosphoglucomutase-like phosphatase (HAD superfamily)